MTVSGIVSEIAAMEPADIAQVLVAAIQAAGRAGREVEEAAARLVKNDDADFGEGAWIVECLATAEYHEAEDYRE